MAHEPESTIAKALASLREIESEACAEHPSMQRIVNLARDARHFLLSTDATEIERYWIEHCSAHGEHDCPRCAAADADDDARRRAGGNDATR